MPPHNQDDTKPMVVTGHTHRSTLQRIVDNALSLFALQGLTYIASFLTVPYLLRTLGTAHFGSFSFANSTMMLFIQLTDFGFASSATRLVAIHAKDRKQLGNLFGAVMSVKLMLLILSALVGCILFLCVGRFGSEGGVIVVAFLQVVGNVLFPAWLFLGLERMKLITVISIIARLISTGMIFLLVHGEHDTMLAMACQSGGYLLQGLIALFFVFGVLRVPLVIPSRAEMWFQIKDSFHSFLAASLGYFVSGSSVLFLGMYKDMNIVGSYAAIERTARAEVIAMQPACQAAYPHISQRFHESRASGNRAFARLCTYLLGGAILFLGAISLFAQKILYLIYGNRLLSESYLFASFSLWSFFSLLNGLLGLHYLIASGHSKLYARSVFWSALSTVALSLAAIPRFGAWGALLAVVIGELVQSILMLFSIFTINRRLRAILIDARIAK